MAASKRQATVRQFAGSVVDVLPPPPPPPCGSVVVDEPCGSVVVVVVVVVTALCGTTTMPKMPRSSNSPHTRTSVDDVLAVADAPTTSVPSGSVRRARRRRFASGRAEVMRDVLMHTRYRAGAV